MAKYRTVQFEDEKKMQATLQLAQETYTNKKLSITLEKIGILLDEGGTTPMSADAPRIFAVKDGKAVTPEEGGMKIGSPAFIEALMKGQIFAYPNGGTAPVQLRGSAFQTKDMPEPEFRVQITDPLTPDPRDNLRPEPAAKPAPKWYHRVFSFIPSNRRRIDEYEQYQKDREAWEQEKQQLQEEYEASANKDEIDVINAAKEKFGAKRDEASLEADKVMQNQVDRRIDARAADSLEDSHIKGVESGIDLMVSVYGTKPKFHEKWAKKFEMDEKGYYMKEHFDTLTSSSLNPAKVMIGDEGLTEREFATIAMFAATNEETSLEQQKISVGDPSGSIETLQKAGYGKEQAERLVADANNTGFTVDILHRNNRMWKNFPAVNSGRDLATKALAVYPAKKEALAEILGRAVEQGGMQAGISMDQGVTAAAKLAGEMLELMERDPELKEMAKKSFERRERAFTENTRIPAKKWDDLVKNIQNKAKFEEVRQKGFAGQIALIRAREQGKDLSPEQKRGYVRDILAGNMVEALRKHQEEKSTNEPASGKEQPFNYQSMLNEFNRLTTFTPGDRGLGATGSGSSMASNASTCLVSALTQRVIKTPDVLTTVTKPAEMEKMMKTLDKIIEADHLVDKSVDELVNEMALPKGFSTYEAERILDKAVKVEQPALDAQKKAPERQLGTQKDMHRERSEPKKTNEEPQLAPLGG